jgi:hypothetical protein
MTTRTDAAARRRVESSVWIHVVDRENLPRGDSIHPTISFLNAFLFIISAIRRISGCARNSKHLMTGATAFSGMPKLRM